MRMAPDFLGTSTIPAHHGVGSSTFETTPITSILASSSLTLVRSGSGTCRGVKRVYGLPSGLSLISYGSLRLPSPLNLRKSLPYVSRCAGG